LIDLSGKITQQYFDEYQTKGAFNFKIQTTGLRDGVYYLRLETKEFAVTRKIVKINQ
jgi:hypothetical protein